MSIRLIPDQAIGEAAAHLGDSLGFEKYANVLAQAAMQTPGPFTIGVFAEWGMGKTSLLHLTQQRLSWTATATSSTIRDWCSAPTRAPLPAHDLSPYGEAVSRTLRLAIIAIVATSWLVACTAPMKIRLALTIQDDSSVTASFVLCGYKRAHIVRVWEKSSPRTWNVTNQDTGDLDPEPHWFTATLLRVPDGWILDEETLTELREDVTYVVSVSDFGGTTPTVDFTLDGLRALGEDEVLVATQRGGRVMTREAFETKALEYCES